MKKIKKIIYVMSFMMLMKVATLSAADTPKFDTSAAQQAASGFIDPFTTFALWAVPILTALILVVSGLMWLAKDEEEKEQKPFMKTAKRIIIVAIICECVPALLKIFGIN